MIHRASTEVDIPLTAKIRVFDDVGQTVKYARMLERAGVKLLTVHGRTKDQKGPLTGLANWEHIKAVKEAVSIPVFANGNIQYLSDVEKCLAETGVQGVMSAEGNLHNPAMFCGTQPPVWQMVLEYLELAQKYPCPISYVRGHLFKLMHHCLTMPENFDLRYRLSKTSTLEQMEMVAKDLKNRLLPYHTGTIPWNPDPESEHARLPFPPWVCQPYVRITPEEHLKKIQQNQRKKDEESKKGSKVGDEDESKGAGEVNKRPLVDGEDISKKKQKKLQKNPRKNFEPPQDQYEKCDCRNPKGGRCAFSLCRACCRVKCYTQELDCPGHRILVKTKRAKAAVWYAQQKKLEAEGEKPTEDKGGEEQDENALGGEEKGKEKEDRVKEDDDLAKPKERETMKEREVMKEQQGNEETVIAKEDVKQQNLKGKVEKQTEGTKCLEDHLPAKANGMIANGFENGEVDGEADDGRKNCPSAKASDGEGEPKVEEQEGEEKEEEEKEKGGKDSQSTLTSTQVCLTST